MPKTGIEAAAKTAASRQHLKLRTLILLISLLATPWAWADSANNGSDDAIAADDFSDVEEVMVMGSFEPAESASDIEKFSVAITDAISIEDLLRSGDSDVASALKRIVGVAVTGGKYANVRGLDGRYISATLNGALMPSTDPFRRDVQLDLFPSEILGGIEIQKSFTADLPADTTGGIIKMRTRDIPDERVAGISVSLGYVDGVTGDDLLSYAGSDTDFFGFDDGTRELPAAIRGSLEGGNFRFSICQIEGQQACVPQNEAVRLAGLIPNNIQLTQDSALPAFGLALKYGNRHKDSSGDYGYYGSLTYDQSASARQGARVDDFNQQGSYDWASQQVSFNGYAVAAYISDAGWTVNSRSMLLRDTEQRTSVEDYAVKGEDFGEVNTVQEWVERQFLGQQFDGLVPLFEKHELTWRVGLSQTNRYSPDRREYLYRSGALAISNYERSYADLSEDGLDLGLEYVLPVAWSSNVFSTLRFGVLSNTRERDNELIRLGLRRGRVGLDLSQDIVSLLALENFEQDYWRLNTNPTSTTDSYLANQDSQGIYLSSETDIGAAVSITAGVRLDSYEVDLRYPNEPTANSDRKSEETLPSVLLTWRPREELQLRSGFARTVSRPNITELANSRFFDNDGRLYFGCPNCSDSTIDNLDLRAEWYGSGKTNASVTAFYKTIDQPLERAVGDGSGSAVSGFTFRNGESATLYGLELDGSTRVWDGIDVVVDLSGNVSWIESEIELSADSARLELNPNRELQGQAPFLANLRLALDDFRWDQKLTLVLNYFDDRIFAAARKPQPTIFESGRLDLNLIYEKQFLEAGKISLKLRNLLNQPIEYTQGGRITESYKRGMALSLGYSRDF